MKKICLFLLIAFFISCTSVTKKEIEMPYSKESFEKTINGEQTTLVTMKNSNGMVVTLTNYGAKIVSIYAPDKNGNFEDVVLGFNSIEDYRKYGASHGAVVGPYANRIANAQFVIEGDTFRLPVNNQEACLHSGPDSWYRRVWKYNTKDNVTTFMLESPDGECGFPGNQKVTVKYTLTDDNELKIDYEVTTDKSTHINITNHSYFNLRGEGNGDILDHILVINANKTTVVKDNSLIPTGEISDIRGTELDFTMPHAIGERIDADNPLLEHGSGYDFNYILNKEPGKMSFAASAYEPESGRYMEVYTTEPAVQLYSGNFLDGSEIGNSGNPYTRRSGFCLETQHFPDTPHHPEFPSTLLKPGEVFESTTIYKFSAKKE